MQSLFLLCPQAPNRIEHIKEIKAKAAWRILIRLSNPPVTVFPGHGLQDPVHSLCKDPLTTGDIGSEVMTDDMEIPKAEMLIGSS